MRSFFLLGVLGWALLSPTGSSWGQGAGLFTEAESLWTPQSTFELDRVSLRSRFVRVDATQLSTMRRRGGELTLNLFDDATFQARIDRVRPSPSGAGSVLTGRLVGNRESAVTLVVNGSVVAGTVRTSQATYSIQPRGFRRHVVFELDRSKPLECGVGAEPFSSPAGTAPSETPIARQATETPIAQAGPTEDGSRIDVMVAYTRAALQRAGGTREMEALIDLAVSNANTAYEASDVIQRIALVHTVGVDYEPPGSSRINSSLALRHLVDPNDGYMDEVHALRDQYAADLVHLMTTGCVGIARPLGRKDVALESSAGFSKSGADCVGGFLMAHELGHSMGLHHDRALGRAYGPSYNPFSHGYVNQRAFEPGAPESSRWYTIMAYNQQCSDAGFNCTLLGRFSNPAQTYRGAPSASRRTILRAAWTARPMPAGT